MQAAATELLSLSVSGLQLTPGNAPTVDFLSWLELQGVLYRRHHGFCMEAMRQRVWDEQGHLLSDDDSVHPPKLNTVPRSAWQAILDRAQEPQPLYETMYPGYHLGSGQEIEDAMAAGLRLAVDVSHIHMQLHQNTMTQKTWLKLQNYPFIGEVHISHNNGDRDQHLPLEADSFGLDWARERMDAGTPIVLESYFHKLDDSQRRKQLDCFLGEWA